MRLAEVTDGQLRLFDRYKSIGGVVDFVVLECAAPEETLGDISAHHKAILLAMQEIQTRANINVEKVSQLYQVPKRKIFRVTINEAKAAALIPKRVSWQEFLGPRFDFDRDGLIVRGKKDFPNDFFYYTDAPRPENIVSSVGIDEGIGTGFAFAFSAPPYGLRGTPSEDVGLLFSKFLNFVICGSTESLIYEWPTDWSNYFEAGQEWWGSFLWSLANPGSDRIIVMAASTTD